MTPDDCIDLGSDMWLAIAGEFNATVQRNGITDMADVTLVFAGLINTMSGHMLGALGPEVTRQILDSAKNNCTTCVRSQFVVVPK